MPVKSSSKSKKKSISSLLSYRRFNFPYSKPRLPSDEALAGSLDSVLTLPKKNPNEFLIFQQKLGQGGGGIVYKVLDTRDNVIKAIKIAHSMDLNELKLEISIHALTTLKHANIVHFEEAFQFEDSIWILMELCDYGSLFDLIEAFEGRIEEKFIAYVTREMLMALALMHRNNFIHRDIKSDNIFLGKNGNVKLADFGWAVGLTTDKSHRTESVGTPHWMAPELVLQQKYGPEVDVWSVAITAIEMAEKQPPFMDKTHARAQLMIAMQNSGEKSGLAMPYERSEEFNTFLKRSLAKDRNERWDAEKLLKEDEFLQTACTRKEFATFIKSAKK